MYQMKNETGDGTAACYQVYPGISVLYNDFHISNCPSRKFGSEHNISIHHCKEGRIEWEVRSGAYLYLASSDIMLDSSATENKECSFPLSHYHGITITISVPEAAENLGDLFELFSIDLRAIENIFQLRSRPFVMHGDIFADHIFDELYHVPESIRKEYFRIKILELLISLKAVDPATLLMQTDESITAIAGKVGYTNSSKFSEAFKSVKGKTPLEYRKIKIYSE